MTTIVVAGAFAAGILARGALPEAPPWPFLVAGAAALAAAHRAAVEPAPSVAALRGGLVPAATDPRIRVLAAAGLWPVRRRSRAAVRPAMPLLLVAVVLLGTGWAALRAPGPVALGALDGRSVSFRAEAAGDPRPSDFGWGLEVRLTTIERAGRRLPLPLRVWVRGDGEPPEIEAGEAIEGVGILRGLEEPAEGFEAWLRDRGVGATLSVGNMRADGPPGNPFLAAANGARRLLSRGAAVALPAREAGLLLGLTIGDTSGMDPEVERDFRATGLGHLVAVSGSNVAMVLAPVLGLAALARAGPKARVGAALLVVAFFALVTRWEPSVLRASAMASLAMIGLLAGRPRDTAALLAAAVLVLLVADPGLAHSLAFRLSVAATAGIVALAGPIAGRLRLLPRPLALAVAATVAAQAGVMPLLLRAFGEVPGSTLPANVLAFPAVGAGFLGGTAASALGLAWEPAGRAVGWVASLPLAYLAEVADRMAAAPLPSLVGTGRLAPLLAGLLVGIVVWRLRRAPSEAGRRRRRRTLLLMAGALLAGRALVAAGPPRALTVTFLDVGQGDAALVQGPAGATILVDGGPEDDEVARRLAALDVRRIDVVVASHAHADHVEGLPAVLSRHPVGVILEPGCAAESPSYRRFLDAVDAEDVPVRHPRGGDAFAVGDLAVEVLGPDACSTTGPNDDSIVVRIRWRDRAVLFPGDAEVPAQEDLLDDGDPVAAQLLKVPHHGGATSAEGFFTAVGSSVAVVSVGENDYGHPHPETLAALGAARTRVLRTDLLGEIRVVLGGEGLHVESAG